jgi:flagella basal body P-ring formation protein FlgA
LRGGCPASDGRFSARRPWSGPLVPLRVVDAVAQPLLAVERAHSGRQGFDTLRPDFKRRKRTVSRRQGFFRAVCGLCMVVAGSAGGYAADGLGEAGKVRSTIRTFLTDLHADYGDSVSVEVGYLDSRLKLADCDLEKEVFLPTGSRSMGHVTVGVRCPGPTPWTVFVSARVGITGKVLVARRALRRGEMLSEKELRSVEKDLGGLTQGYLTGLPQAVGKQLKRSAREGQVIAPAMLESAPLVRRGEQVGIVFNAETFYVRAEGVALADGGAGETIRVRNRTSEKVIDAVVIAASLVRVNR